MAFALHDMVWETSTVTGTGSATLLGAHTNAQGTADYRTFSAAGFVNNDTTFYFIRNRAKPATEWESGIGTWQTGGILARTTVIESSNANALVVFTAGTKDVICALPGSKVMLPDNVAITGGSITGTTGVGYTLQSAAPTTNPTDAQTIYQGLAGPISTTADVYTVPIPVAGTIIRIQLEVAVGGTLGTGETATVSLLLNNATTVAISSAVTFTAARQQFNSGAVSQAVAVGDRFQIRCVNPTWVTNPTGVVLTASVFIRT